MKPQLSHCSAGVQPGCGPSKIAANPQHLDPGQPPALTWDRGFVRCSGTSRHIGEGRLRELRSRLSLPPPVPFIRSVGRHVLSIHQGRLVSLFGTKPWPAAVLGNSPGERGGLCLGCQGVPELPGKWEETEGTRVS